MMQARFLRSATLAELRNQVAVNLAIYRTGSFSHLGSDQSCWFEYAVSVDDASLSQIINPTLTDDFEVENCKLVLNALVNLKPYEARDERLWVYLSHTLLLEHARKRWPIPDDDQKAVAHIKTHFFAKDKRGLERDQVVSRLWWMAHLCGRAPSLKQEIALRALLYKSDVRANIIERPTSSQCRNLFEAILQRLSTSYEGKKLLFERLAFRKFMKEVNSVGGFKLLDCLPPSEISNILDDIIKVRLNLPAL